MVRCCTIVITARVFCPASGMLSWDLMHTCMVQRIAPHSGDMYLHTSAQKAPVAPAQCGHSASCNGPDSAGSARIIFCDQQHSHYPVLCFTRALLWLLGAKTLNHVNGTAFSWCSEDSRLEISIPMCYAVNHQHSHLLFLQGGILTQDTLVPKNHFRQFQHKPVPK